MRPFALPTLALGCCALLGSLPGTADERASMTVAQVRAVLAASAASGRPATFAGRRLVDLNLDGLDFRKAIAHVRGRAAIRGLKAALNVDQAIFR
jgi:hypothetical protein